MITLAAVIDQFQSDFLSECSRGSVQGVSQLDLFFIEVNS